MDARTIVTGGAGFIGSHLVDRWWIGGERVRVVERPGADVAHLPPRVEVVRADIRDRRGRRGGHERAPVRLPPRGQSEPLGPRPPASSTQSTIGGPSTSSTPPSPPAPSGSCTRAPRASSPVLGATGPIAEDVEVGLEDAVGPYCRSKLQAENEAMARARAGWPVVVANPTMPVGPGDRGMSPPSRLIRDFCRGKLPARMDCTLNLIDVRDVAEGLIRTMDRGQPGRRYLLGGENLTLVGLLGILSELTGVPVPRWSVPYPVGLAVAYAQRVWAAITSPARPPRRPSPASA